jgi:hypothetical protein
MASIVEAYTKRRLPHDFSNSPPTRPHYEGEASGVVHTAGFDLPFFIEGQLFAQEEDFRAQG